jgi:hypothetical protein
MAEHDLRLNILNTLLTTPHRQLQQIWPVHQQLIQQDPRFYVRLAAWYSDHGDVRDHKEMFIIALVLSTFPGHRNAGLALLRNLPPYQVGRVVDFVSGRKEKVTVRVEQPGVKRPKRLKATAPAGSVPAKTETLVEDFGLFRNPPRSLKTEVERYLREREADADWFDGTVLTARKVLKRLYALLHIKPGERAQQILFDEQPPANSRLAALKQLANTTDAVEQARIIRAAALPYRVAVTVVAQPTPIVWAALVERMSPQELINSMGLLQRRNLLEHELIKPLIDAKLDKAQSAGRVSALKAGEALKAVKVSDETKAKLEAVADKQVKAKGRITRPVCMLIDKSGSMQVAIELGKRIGALLSSVCENKLYVYAFDALAIPIDPGKTDLASWERALAGINADGATSIGVGVEMLRRKKQYVEQIILVTDEGENTAPLFVETLKKYRDEVKADPNVCIVRTPNGDSLIERQCKAAGIMVDVFQFTGDYYSLPNLIPLLARPSKLELLLEIMDYPLPERKPA